MPAVDREKDTIICDLDGTIALDVHRNHYLHPPHKEKCDVNWEEAKKRQRPGYDLLRVCSCGWKRDWTTYFSLCGSDDPNWPVIDTLRLYWEDGYNIRILSGRSASVQDVTEKWLRQHGVPYHTIRLRDRDCRIDDHILKIKWAEEMGYFPSNVLTVFEDRSRVVEAWRNAGYSCFQVAQGLF